MRPGRVLNHGQPAGRLVELDDETFEFTYDVAYRGHPVSLTLPMQVEPHRSAELFPFFAGLLAEGSTRAIQHRVLRIDEEDDFGLLLATGADPIGAVSVEPE